MCRRRMIVAAVAVCAAVSGCWNAQLPVSADRNEEDLETPASCRAVYGFSISYDEQWLAYYGMGKAIHIRQLPVGEPAASLCYRNCEVRCAEFHPCEHALLACYVDGSVVRWTRSGGPGGMRRRARIQRGGTWRPHLLGRLPCELQCCAVSPGGDYFAVGTSGGDVVIWTLGPEPRAPRILKHSRPVWSVRFAPGGNELVVCGPQAMLRLWNVQTWTPADVVTGHRGVISVASLSDDGRLLVTAGHDGTLRMTDRSSGRPLWSVNVSEHGLRTVAFSSDGCAVAVGTVFCGNVQFRDVRTGGLLHVLPAHQSTVSRVQFLTDGTLVTSSHDGAVEIFEHLPLSGTH